MTRRIGCSPLTGHIFMDRVNGDAFIGQKQDVTSDVLGAILDKARFHGGGFDILRQDGKRWIVRVTEEASASASEPMARFCPNCGRVGLVPESARDCCPDGSHARVIPKALAEQCHATFMRGIAE